VRAVENGRVVGVVDRLAVLRAIADGPRATVAVASSEPTSPASKSDQPAAAAVRNRQRAGAVVPPGSAPSSR
jgi:hypothetical protein